MEVVLTKHAIKRAKDRMSLNKSAIKRLSKKAFELGVDHSSAKGKLNKYITYLYFKNKSINNTRIYGDFIYLFQGNVLVTVYHLPKKYRKYIQN